MGLAKIREIKGRGIGTAKNSYCLESMRPYAAVSWRLLYGEFEGEM